jgi:hypothetical protein
MKKVLLYILFVYSVPTIIIAQNIPVDPSHTSIYDFLDEQANNKLININSITKPYTREQILNYLLQLDTCRRQIDQRQNKELDFYLRIYNFNKKNIVNPYSSNARLNLFNKNSNLSTGINPLGLFYKDSLISMSIKPILGIRYYLNEHGNIRYTWGGAEAYFTIGSHWGFYASLRENNMSDVLAYPSSFVQNEGGNYKIDAEGIHAVTYSEMRGGLTYSWDWGSLGLVKDQIQWGINYNGANIFSGRTPSFPMIKLDLYPIKWFDFHYFHGWLVSEVIDSARSYITSNGDYRAVYRNKYIAANLYTFKLWRYLHFSFGNSIIYSDVNVQPAYLIPFLFYKSVDHTLSNGIDNENSQMFFALSSRLINHVHLYANVFVDDFSVKRISDKERHNFVGTKAGFRLSDWPIKNISLTGEYTKTNPVVYKHRIETLTFESNKYNLGHYLRDNSQEIFLMMSYKPVRGINISISYLNAKHGNEYQYTNGLEAEYYPYMKDVTWKNEQYNIELNYELFSEAYLYIGYMHSQTQGFDVDGKTAQYYLNYFTPEYLQGKKNTFMVSLNIGF